MSVTVAREGYRGWEDTHRLANGLVEARVVADVGPRVVELRCAGGANLFHVRDAEIGGSGEPVWRFRGGWRLWIAPERHATTYALDNARCATATPAPGTLVVTGPPQPEASVRKTVALTIDATRPRLVVESRVANVGRAPVAFAPWSLAALRPGGRAFVPLDVGPPEAFDAIRRVILWSYTRIDDPRYRFGDALVAVEHAAVADGPAPRPIAPGRTSDESKIGVDAAAGWAAYLLDETLFVTRAVVERGPRADGGATLEIFSSRAFVELEHLGVLRDVRPGDAAVLREDWWLFEGVRLPPAAAGLAAVGDALAPWIAEVMRVPLAP
jgi:hypothetical protein